MKRFFAILLTLALMFSLAACGGGSELEKAAREIESITGEATTADDVKEAMEQMESLTGEKVTAQDVVDFTRSMYELANDKTPSGGDTPPSNSQQQEQNTPAPEDESDDEDGDENESFVGKYDFAKDYMIPAAGSYQGYREVKYMDGTLKNISFDVAEITEQEMNDYTATLEANGYEFKGDEGDDFATTGKRYRNDSEGVSIVIGYMKMDDDYRISIHPFEVAN